MELHGAVKLKEGESRARRHGVVRSHLAMAVLMATRRGATLQPKRMRRRLRFSKRQATFCGGRRFRSTDYLASPAPSRWEPRPANITADTLQANSRRAAPFIKGMEAMERESHARSGSIELQRDARLLNAVGNVRAVFVQAPQTTRHAIAEKNAATLVRFRANLTYWTRRTAHT